MAGGTEPVETEAARAESPEPFAVQEPVALTGTGFRVCTSADHRVLPEPPQPVATTLTEEACVSLTAGPYSIGPTGDVTFIAGERIILLNDFSTQGDFTAVIDPLL